MSPAAATSSNPRTLNFVQSVLATLKTAIGSPAAWGAAGSFAWAFVVSPVTAPIHLVAGVIGVSSETEHRLAKRGIAYKSIPTHMNEAFAPVGNLLNNIPADSVPGKIKKTLSDAWQSPVLAVHVGAVGYAANTAEALVRAGRAVLLGDTSQAVALGARAAISLLYVGGELAAANQVEGDLKLESHSNPEGVFAGVKSWYKNNVPKPVKAVFSNTGFWFPAGNAATMVDQGVKTLLNPFGAIGFGIATFAAVTALNPLKDAIAAKFLKQQQPSENAAPAANQPWLVSAVGGFSEKVSEFVLGPKAGRAQRLGAVGDGLAAINSLMTGSPLNGVAFGSWGRSNWLYGGLSNKAAAEAAAANQAQQAR
jgi:hypothetical protein